ncbi:zinc-dependent alcohol dehydrogenase [Meiothermus ruber]|uniref:Alcohol dehydrogenase GroES domain protein n=1 Tax=Meiothermus ruber (strain ATCC 35948 / DSM 1279 / VKM B-1258 / 21) TaxID=504728 RepID=D3PTN5_MEIRD|nr:alcohol dehydrogenase catalytic domain-containing protein [Meiothermus ruber]ADD28818.1 Alcohol dehydrogenase GroES domain protein [Meiothermus ruber DSM 1279]AGK05733.1 Alcohol dehydrogenase GroES domain-containing protein [Meiothermus ruber DSM 1279]MCL6529429.1 alcohol dehydrogenase catalytic domain-containing protein [Meiothermus ruber]GAO75730.1 Alcohol dehydrogenase GroES domain-containing protein [Meiothermus ruber H328]
MRAVIPAPHVIQWSEADPPQPQHGEVLLEPLAIGVCGSDLHVYEGQHPFVRYPVFPGHEVAARVVEVGSGVDPAWRGALVALEPALTCGQCVPCRSGRYNICERLRVMGFQAPGALAERFVSPVQNLHRLPQGFDIELGAMVEPLAVAVHAVALTPVQGKRVAVLGAGTIGLLVAQVAKAYGAAQVVVVDLLEARRRAAEGLGLAAKAPDAAKYEVIFECVGNERALEAAIQGAHKGGTVVVVGVYGRPTTLSAGLVQDWELTLKGSLMYTFSDFQEAIRLLAQQRVLAQPLVTHRFALNEVQPAFAAALGRDKALKVLLLA